MKPIGGTRRWYAQRLPVWTHLFIFAITMLTVSLPAYSMDVFGLELSKHTALLFCFGGMPLVPLTLREVFLRIYAKELFQKLPSEGLKTRGHGFRLNGADPKLHSLSIYQPLILLLAFVILLLFGLITLQILQRAALIKPMIEWNRKTP